MSERLLDWVRLPSKWIEQMGLRTLRWAGGAGSANTSALMVLLVIAHHADQATGIARLTYDDLSRATGLSRATISAGLGVLTQMELIVREPRGRSTFGLANFDPKVAGWAKIPARKLYDGGSVVAFRSFKLRHAAELNALKLYLLFAARRGNDTNQANISYDKITEYSGIERGVIPRALSILHSLGLIYAENGKPSGAEFGVSRAYRLVHLDSFVHTGTRGRSLEPTTVEL